MGKISAAKKKERRKDFQKVKFKVGKKLPKNQNETRATFKAKTLILKKQFATEKDGPVSHRNLSWKDLLAHLGHSNQAIKLDAIHSLKEMITHNQSILRFDLNNFLENIFPLFSDRDYRVREACMQLFKTFILLPEISRANSLEPFYSLLNVHLSCAMTHISENVQNDSLKLLDILIDTIPDLVRINAYTIFDNFVDQISKATLRGSRRTLKNDPYKMTSTQAWRSKVLSRLYKMLLIVSSVKSQVKSETLNVFNFESTKWLDMPNGNRSVLVEIDANRKCSVASYERNKSEKQPLKICKRISGKKDVTEVKEFFEHFFKVITPLLVDCWIEAKPENKNIIETYESLSIMNSVMSILNLLLENLQYDFTSIGKLIRTNRDLTPLAHTEQLFLGHFPFCLAENFEYTSDSKKTNQTISANTINLLLCKFCSSSLLQLTDKRKLEVFQYSLNTLVIDKSESQQRLEMNELVTVLNLSNTIFENFTNSDITKPFLIALTKYFDSASKFSNNKWLVFNFLCKQFYENNNLKNFSTLFIAFFKKTCAYCIVYARDRRDKLEQLIDWLRQLVIKKGKSEPIILASLEDEFINLLNALDFESKDVSESCKKKLLELIYWLPKISSFLFTKLSILILKKNLSIINTNQLLNILKIRLESTEPAFELTDYLIFLTCLFNGSSGFDLLNSAAASPEFFTLDCDKFKQHELLCQHLEEFTRSHKHHERIVDFLINSTIPVFPSLSSISCRTLYGSLSLLTQLTNLSSKHVQLQSNYNNIIRWLTNAKFWLLNKIHSTQVYQLGSHDQNEANLKCFNLLLKKIAEVYTANPQLLTDSVPHLVDMLHNSTDIDQVRKIFVVINYLLVKFDNILKNSSKYLITIRSRHQEFDNSNYLWWHEYCTLLKAL